MYTHTHLNLRRHTQTPRPILTHTYSHTHTHVFDTQIVCNGADYIQRNKLYARAYTHTDTHHTHTLTDLLTQSPIHSHGRTHTRTRISDLSSFMICATPKGCM